MNIELLLKVKEQILREPRQFNMEHYFFTYEEGYEPDTEEEKIPNCGTAACIAGWAIAIAYQQNPREANQNLNSYAGPIARDLLELHYMQSERLFHTCDWPKRFKDEYFSANTNQERAEVAARRIDHFIATKGEE